MAGKMKLVDSYEKTDIQGQTHLLELEFDQEKKTWEVSCWKVHDDDEQHEHMWTVNGVVTGYKMDNPNLEIREPFTEETARKEFERWRN